MKQLSSKIDILANIIDGLEAGNTKRGILAAQVDLVVQAIKEVDKDLTDTRNGFYKVILAGEGRERKLRAVVRLYGGAIKKGTDNTAALQRDVATLRAERDGKLVSIRKPHAKNVATGQTAFDFDEQKAPEPTSTTGAAWMNPPPPNADTDTEHLNRLVRASAGLARKDPRYGATVQSRYLDLYDKLLEFGINVRLGVEAMAAADAAQSGKYREVKGPEYLDRSGNIDKAIEVASSLWLPQAAKAKDQANPVPV